MLQTAKDFALIPLFLALLCCLAQGNQIQSSSQSCRQSYGYKILTDGYLCIGSAFTVTHWSVTSEASCSILCSRNQRCQGLTTANGSCQLFVFDKCSKNVRSDCNCPRRGRVLVKQQPGLTPGALCPSGYGDDLCGVKYRLYSNSGLWWPSRQKCDSEPGLTIMADVVDATEMGHVDSLYVKYSIGSFWLGGYQPAGSLEPAGGWYWVACNIALSAGLWGDGEPNNFGSKENVIGRFSYPKLCDFSDTWTEVNSVLCECVSPFA